MSRSPREGEGVFSGEALAELQVRYPGQWVKLFFFAKNDGEALGRAYTILDFDAEKREMTIDFFLHDGGIASEWPRHTQVGASEELHRSLQFAEIQLIARYSF